MSEERAAILGTQQRDSQGPSGCVENDDDMGLDKPTDEEKRILLERKNRRGRIILVKEQTNEERHEIRTELEAIKEKLKKVDDGATVINLSEVERDIVRCNAIHEKIQYLREGSQDQELMTLAFEVVKKLTSKLKTSQRKFDLEEFAKKIKSFYTKNRDGLEEDSDEESGCKSQYSIDIKGRRIAKKREIEIQREDWAQVGKLAWSILKECPPLKVINGSFNAEEVEVRERQKKERQKRQANPPLEKLQKKTGAGIDSMDTTQMVDNLWMQLCQRCRGGQAISYFEVVLDPKEFGRTLENMLSVSFLVQLIGLALSLYFCQRRKKEEETTNIASNTNAKIPRFA